MPILIGLILMALGISLAVGQWAMFLVVLRAVVALGCLFWGVVSVLIGYSEMKARREYCEAVRPESNASPQAAISASNEGAKSPTVARETPPVSPAQ